jgi:hypothetical protein
VARLCGRPGCSEVGVVAYGMVPEDLLFWIAPIADSPVSEPSLLCGRHADAMVVPRGWTLDDRREHALRLFKPRPIERPPAAPRRPVRRARDEGDQPEQLQIDGTGEIVRPTVASALAGVPHDEPHIDEPHIEEPHIDEPHVDEPAADAGLGAGRGAAWEPEFDHDDDLNGLLEVSSPLLARAFRGTGRPPRR